ncbi:MAG: DNA polymerase III subunit delta [Candidatus Bipolaricaulia bacterium]
MKQIFLFTGDDYLRERALRRKIDEIRETTSAILHEAHLDGEELRGGELLEELFTPSLFAPGKLILIRRADKLPESAGLLKLLERGLPGGFFILLTAEKLDRRGKLYKLVAEQGEVEDHPKPDRRSLPKLVKELLREHQVELTGEAFRYLLEASDPDLHRLANEIEKLSIYPYQGPLGVEELRELIFGARGPGLFTFLDQLSERRPEAVVSLRGLLDEGEDPSKIFFMIAGQVRALLAVNSLAGEGHGIKQIAAETGQYPWLVKKRLSQVKNFSEEELIELVYLLQEKDASIKRGESEPEAVLYEITLALTGVGVACSRGS